MMNTAMERHDDVDEDQPDERVGESEGLELHVLRDHVGLGGNRHAEDEEPEEQAALPAGG